MENKTQKPGLPAGALIRSPEQLNDFVRVAGPGVWLVLGAILLLLAGFGVWAVFGHLDTTLKIPVVVDETGTCTAYVEEYSLTNVSTGMTLTAGDKSLKLGAIDQTPVQASEALGTYWLHLFDLWEEQWLFPVSVENNGLAEGVYTGEIITESVSPLLLIFN